ncbi:lipopolysaccharide biosynthesis protein [Thalassotalea psychrophila]|uniref:Lipopolysaccharide biosynthesis protein n=1 Tax=Thalassotalea psychrophila TaxID=3065647 RepID=A0ABY9TR66_9GAMM|nr:lipopolysaccharide biosynthesis protein [Colwelliaceae bacterium SQ149]
MSRKQIEKIEEEFQKLKGTATETQWNNPDYIIRISKEYDINNVALAYRLMQRAHNLRPNGPAIKARIEKLKQRITTEQPKAIISQSKFEKNLDRSKSFARMYSPLLNSLIDKWRLLPHWFKQPIVLSVFLPWLCFSLYQIIWASPRYESQSQLIVRQPDDMATLDASMAVLSGLGMPATNTDTQLVEAYINSNDMLQYLAENISIKEHFGSISSDFFSRLHNWDSNEDFLAYYQEHILVEIDDVSSIISVKTQGFSPEYAQLLNETIVERAEWFINSVGHKVAQEQLKFVQGEHDITAKKLELAKTNLLAFQKEHNLLDPETEGMAFQKIAYTLEGELSAKKAELYAMKAVMSDDSPKVLSLERVIHALEEQLNDENSRLSGHDESSSLTVGEKVAMFSDYKIDLEIALQTYAGSLVSLEKTRIEAYRKMQFLVVVESSTLPEDNQYPEVVYNISLFGIVLLLFFGIIKIIIATIKELN